MRRGILMLFLLHIGQSVSIVQQWLLVFTDWTEVPWIRHEMMWIYAAWNSWWSKNLLLKVINLCRNAEVLAGQKPHIFVFQVTKLVLFGFGFLSIITHSIKMKYAAFKTSYHKKQKWRKLMLMKTSCIYLGNTYNRQSDLSPLTGVAVMLYV